MTARIETARRRLWPLAVALVVVIGVGVFSVQFRGRPPGEENVEYGSVGGRPLLLDIHRPTNSTGTRPAVILIHGGGWVEGSKADHRDLAEGLRLGGYIVFSVNYRLARDDTSRYPAQVDDVRRAVRWVRANAERLGIDPDRIGALGYSAGGHLAAMLGVTDVEVDGDSSRVNCVVDCSGPADFTDESSPPLGPQLAWMVPNLFGKTRSEAPETYRDASPISHVDARSVPTLILHGTDDDIVPLAQSRRLRDSLRNAGVEVMLIELEGEGHNFGPEGHDRMIRELAAFFRRHLKP